MVIGWLGVNALLEPRRGRTLSTMEIALFWVKAFLTDGASQLSNYTISSAQIHVVRQQPRPRGWWLIGLSVQTLLKPLSGEIENLELLK